MSDAQKVTPGKPAKSETRVLQSVTASASSIFVIAIVLMLNYLAFRHYERLDWTTQGMFTLSPKSKVVLRDLGQDVDVYLFMSQGEGSFQTTDELLKRYTAASPRVHVHHVDPERDATQFKLLAQRFGIAAGVIETGEARADVAAVVAIGDKNWHVNREDLVSQDFSVPGDQSGEQQLNVKAEQALTGAIVQVTSGRATKVCVTRGHGEWSLDEGSERSLVALKTGLRHDNVVWDAFETLGQKEVPKGCDAVFVLGPLRAFSEPEAKLLFDYLKAGGNLLLALDPVIELDQVSQTGFETQLGQVGIRADRALVLELSDDRLLGPNQPAQFVVTDFGDHPTTRPLQHAARVFMSLVRSVTPSGDRPDVEILMRTSDKAFGKTAIAEVKADAEPTKSPTDIAGPVSVAVAVQVTKTEQDTSKKTGGRLIVVGDSDFLQGPLLESQELANLYLASAWTGFLTERPALIEIPPKTVKTGNVVFTQDDLWALLFRVAILVPGAAFVLGFAVWLNRRS